MAYSSGDFGGGINGTPFLAGGRGDGTVMATWELNGMGVGNYYQTKTRRTQMNEASIHVREVQARVGAEVTAAAKVAAAHQAALTEAQEAVRQAEDTWERLEKLVFGIASGKYEPLEPLTAEQALDAARTEYLREVIEFNRAQFRLYWAGPTADVCAAEGDPDPGGGAGGAGTTDGSPTAATAGQSGRGRQVKRTTARPGHESPEESRAQTRKHSR